MSELKINYSKRIRKIFYNSFGLHKYFKKSIYTKSCVYLMAKHWDLHLNGIISQYKFEVDDESLRFINVKYSGMPTI